MFDPELQTVAVEGKSLKCLVCGNDEFRRRRAQLNIVAGDLHDLFTKNTSSEALICGSCGFVHFFYSADS